jgi:hypothetical protein
MKLQTCYGILVLSACLAGCSFDFTDIPADTPARLGVVVESSTLTDSLIVFATLDPGRDSDTNIRPVLSDLLVSGRSFSAVPTGINGTQVYQADWSLSDDLPADASFVIRAPDIEGLQSTAQTFSVSIPERIGGDTMFVGDDESVVLRLATVTTSAEHASWLVEVTDSMGVRVLSVIPAGHPPEEIVIPRSWLSASRVQNVQVRIFQGYSGEVVPGEYRWSASVRTLIHWTVILSDAP